MNDACWKEVKRGGREKDEERRQKRERKKRTCHFFLLLLNRSRPFFFFFNYRMATEQDDSPQELARLAYIYGFPIVDNYRILYSYFVDEGGPGKEELKTDGRWRKKKWREGDRMLSLLLLPRGPLKKKLTLFPPSKKKKSLQGPLQHPRQRPARLHARRDRRPDPELRHAVQLRRARPPRFPRCRHRPCHR